MTYLKWLIENEPYCLVFEKCYTPWTNGKKTELERALEEGREIQLGL